MGKRPAELLKLPRMYGFDNAVAGCASLDHLQENVLVRNSYSYEGKVTDDNLFPKLIVRLSFSSPPKYFNVSYLLQFYTPFLPIPLAISSSLLTVLIWPPFIHR